MYLGIPSGNKIYPEQNYDPPKRCSKCGAEAQPDTDPPMCTQHLQETSECPPNAGSGRTPWVPADEEMEAIEARDLNEDEGDK